jgi:uncharacterized protein YndB with AHSA1/START domain
MTTTQAAVTTQVYRVYIKATPEAVWDAITNPEWTQRYGYRNIAEYDLRPGGSFRALWPEAVRQEYDLPEVAVDGEVIEADPPHKIVQTWRMAMDAEMAAEGFTRLTHEIAPAGDGVRLTVIHELEGAPKLAAMVAGESEDTGAGGGWAWILSDLKSLLETGSAFTD